MAGDPAKFGINVFVFGPFFVFLLAGPSFV
jgi:hypothetical protein